MPKFPIKYPARLNLHMRTATYDAFKGVADELGIETAELVRQCLDANVGAMHATQQALIAGREGRVKEGLGLFNALVNSALSQGEVYRLQGQDMLATAVDGPKVVGPV